MRSIGRGEDRRAGGAALLDPPEVDIGGREQADAAVVMFRVVPGEEDVAMGARVLDRAEPLGKRRPVLQRLELGLRERVVVRHLWPAVRLGDRQAGEQEGDGLRGHRRTPASVYG